MTNSLPPRMEEMFSILRYGVCDFLARLAIPVFCCQVETVNPSLANYSNLSVTLPHWELLFLQFFNMTRGMHACIPYLLCVLVGE